LISIDLIMLRLPVSCDDGKSLDSISFSPETSLLSGLFGDLAIVRGDWPILGQLPSWDRKDWPLPRLSTKLANGSFRLTRYDEDTLEAINEKITQDERLALRLPEDGVMGYKYVELMLSSLICPDNSWRSTKAMAGTTSRCKILEINCRYKSGPRKT
jgi:hypothetical protein